MTTPIADRLTVDELAREGGEELRSCLCTAAELDRFGCFCASAHEATSVDRDSKPENIL